MKVFIEHSKERAVFTIVYGPTVKDIEAYDVPTNVFEKGLSEVHDYIIRYINRRYGHLARDAIIVFIDNPECEPIDFELLWEW